MLVVILLSLLFITIHSKHSLDRKLYVNLHNSNFAKFLIIACEQSEKTIKKARKASSDGGDLKPQDLTRTRNEKILKLTTRPEFETKHTKLENEAPEIRKRRNVEVDWDATKIGKRNCQNKTRSRKEKSLENSKMNPKKSENEMSKALKLGETEAFKTTI